MFRALVVDDYPFIRAAIISLLQKENIDAIAEAATGAEAIFLARELLPELIILDISMMKLDGLEVISRLTNSGIKSKILVFTSLSPIFYARRCMHAGAAGFVSKSDSLLELPKAINMVMSGYSFFPFNANKQEGHTQTEQSEFEVINKLSDREIIILQKLSLGYNNKEIGDVMLLSNKTVSAYKQKILERFSVKSVVDLAEIAKRHQLT